MVKYASKVFKIPQVLQKALGANFLRFRAHPWCKICPLYKHTFKLQHMYYKNFIAINTFVYIWK